VKPPERVIIHRNRSRPETKQNKHKVLIKSSNTSKHFISGFDPLANEIISGLGEQHLSLAVTIFGESRHQSCMYIFLENMAVGDVVNMNRNNREVRQMIPKSISTTRNIKFGRVIINNSPFLILGACTDRKNNSASDWSVVIGVFTSTNCRQESIRRLNTCNTCGQRNMIDHDLLSIVFEFAMVGMKGATSPKELNLSKLFMSRRKPQIVMSQKGLHCSKLRLWGFLSRTHIT